MDKLLVILGPTSTGKTDLGLFLAKKFNGELVSCDSRQVYRGLDIGTGKLPSGMLDHDQDPWSIKKANGWWEVNGIKIWMYDVIDPKIQYSVADYIQEARQVISDIRRRNKLPIVVGGSGLYLKGLLSGLSNLSIPINNALRKRLEKLSLQDLQKKLQSLSLSKWSQMNYSDRQNPRRLLRSIEIISQLSSAKPTVQHLEISDIGQSSEEILKIGLTAPRKVIYDRSDKRVVERINQGLVAEAQRLSKEGLSFKRMKQLGLEYGVLAQFLEKKITQIEGEKGLIKLIQYKIHGYIRRQLVWFKKEKGVVWFDITQKNTLSRVEKRVAKWYINPDAT